MLLPVFAGDFLLAGLKTVVDDWEKLLPYDQPANFRFQFQISEE
jgi:hypothetical protein